MPSYALQTDLEQRFGIDAVLTASDRNGKGEINVPIVTLALVDATSEIDSYLAAKYDLIIPSYGHAGDGNIHTRVVTNPAWTLKKWQAVRPRLIHDLYELTARLGGRVSGEHGVGHKRKKYLPMFLAREHIELLRRLKRALDPNNILNPGKIVDV